MRTWEIEHGDADGSLRYALSVDPTGAGAHRIFYSMSTAGEGALEYDMKHESVFGS